jgi:predicted RNase H-like nuclease (RuvC/YqgF family)
MPEDNTESLNADSTNPVPFEDFVKQHLTLLLNQVERLNGEVGRLNGEVGRLNGEVGQLKVELSNLRQETMEGFIQVGRLFREQDARLGRIEERFEDIDYKLDDFIKEQIRMKREWREYQESK